MSAAARFRNDADNPMMEMRMLADQAFSRAAGAPLVEGNRVRLLKDASENYPAWFDAIAAAQHYILFENYIFREDPTGQKFADALCAKARDGVPVRLIYDWMGGFGKTSQRFWNRLRGDGVEVRCYNPPRLDSPLGWVNRDHRKMLAVDGEVAFVSGLCIGRMWEGVPEKRIEPWRDTGIEVRGPSVASIELAFAQVWAMLGDPIPEHETGRNQMSGVLGETALRVVATVPATAGLFRLDHLVAALARNRLWLTDAYYAGTSAYMEALKTAARDGVDVRLLVPNATDIPVLKLLSRAGYRPLLEAGIRIFEWNGTMLHAKTAVADQRWARIGSTNLNIFSWHGNCELDVVVEDAAFARKMEAMYLQDLTNATEVVLDAKRNVRAPGEPHHPRPVLASGSGRAGRAGTGAVRIGKAVGAAFRNLRELDPVEARLMTGTGVLFLILAALFALFPRVLAYPLMMILAWLGFVLLYRAYQLHREGRKKKNTPLRHRGSEEQK